MKSITQLLFGPSGIPNFDIPDVDESTQIKYGKDIDLYFTFLCVDFDSFGNFLKRNDDFREATIRAWLQQAQNFESENDQLGSGLFATLFVSWLGSCVLEGRIVIDNALSTFICLSKKHFNAGGERGFVYFFDEMSKYPINE